MRTLVKAGVLLAAAYALGLAAATLCQHLAASLAR